jgi:2'-5' RNA ligase
MRLFIALNLPKSERERIDKAAQPLREEKLPVRWLVPDHFHVTLKFLGEVRKERLPQVEEAMARVAASTKAFKTKLGGFGAFPTVRRPQVIWLGVAANPELRCLKQDLEWTLGPLGFEAEMRAFHPHVTLGRADDRDGVGVFRRLDELMAALKFRGEIHVQTIDLMRSQTSREGSTYTLLSSAKLSATLTPSSEGELSA